MIGDYRELVGSFLNIADDVRVKAKVELEIAEGPLWPEP